MKNRYLFLLRGALTWAAVCLRVATAEGYRTDCLRAAVKAIEGALANAEGEVEDE